MEKKSIEQIRKNLALANNFKAPTKDDNYGVELIMDIKNCDISKFNRKDLEEYCIKICELTKMQRADLHFWDFEGQDEAYGIYKEEAPHLCGTSLCQFITTSNITIHSLDQWGKLYINLFTCKPFEPEEAIKLTLDFFSGELLQQFFITRK
jgi:S-adenosylmethionine/arginine decarboxylase-like enzyme